jgi:hypothetical protein
MTKEKIYLLPVTNAEARGIADNEFILTPTGGQLTPEMEAISREIIEIIDTETPKKDQDKWDHVSYANGYIRGLYAALNMVRRSAGVVEDVEIAI